MFGVFGVFGNTVFGNAVFGSVRSMFGSVFGLVFGSVRTALFDAVEGGGREVKCPSGPHDSDNPAQATTMSTLEINDASRSLGLCLSIAKEYISTYLECQDFQIFKLTVTYYL